MAKQATPQAAGTIAASEVQAGPVTTALSRFKVRLAAKTPIAHATLVIEAATAEDAKQAFMAANGISGSACEWTVEETDEPVTELKK